MVSYQTSVQHKETIRFGSAKVEVGASVGSLLNLGLASNIEFTEEYEPIVLKPDNAPEIFAGVKDHTATVKFDMWEVKLSNLNLIRGGFDTYGQVAGSSTPVTSEEHTLTGTNFVRLNQKNGNGAEVSTIVVKNSTNATAARNTDYVVAVDAAGYTCIARIANSTVIGGGEKVNVSYTYSPNRSTTLSSGGKNTISAKVVRLTNTNADGKIFRITVYAARNQSGITLTLPSDDGDEPLKPTIELKGVCDNTREAGAQLFEIYDEQEAW